MSERKFSKDDLELIDYLRANFKSRRDLYLRSRAAYKGLSKYYKDILDEALPSLHKDWTLEECKEIALRYNTRSEWEKNDNKSYSAALRNGWLEQCCGHMEAQHWTLEECKEIALRYKTRSEWKKNDNKSYQAAYKKGWLEQCCGHMEAQLHNWTLEECKEIALRYKTRSEWKKNDNKSYQAALRNGWLEQCCGHMKKRQA
jgi:uncharacterized protein YnzC (UPF0291/DUF896 family)